MARNAVVKIEFDYAPLDAEARTVVRQKTTEIRDRVSRAALNIFEIGERLIAVKESLPHGQFVPWLQTEFEWSESAANKMMQVAVQFKSVKFTDLSVGPSALYLLASSTTPPKVKTEFIDAIESGKPVTHKAVKAAIRKASPEVFFDDEKPAKKNGKPAPEPPKDELGQSIKDPKIVAIFARRPEVHTLLHSLSQIKSKVLGAIEDKDTLFYRVDPAQFRASIEGVRRQIKFTEPYALCGYCQGRNPNCKACKGQGWLSKDAHDRFVPEDLKV